MLGRQMNNNINSSALFRSLIVYAICVPLAIIIGFMLTNPLDVQSLGFIGVLAALLVFPLLMKWHYHLLVFSWSAPITLFFLPGHPSLFIAMVMTSLSISVVERILNREKHFVPTARVKWSLLALLAVVFVTAKLTGGFGFRSLGSDVYGGKKYATLIIGILSFFAITAQPIPREKANLYVLLYCAGGFFNFISDLFTLVPSPLHFIFLLFPANSGILDAMGNYEMDWRSARLGGISGTAGAVFMWMLFRHGIRNIFLAGKLQRPVIFCLAFALIFLGGYRSAIFGAVVTFGVLFFMEKLYRTRLMLPLVLAGIAGGVALVPLAPHLPYTFQRALASLPLNIDKEARMSAEGSTEWRLLMWQAILPQLPGHLLLGKGYAFSAQTYNEVLTQDSAFSAYQVLDASQQGLAVAGDYHSGPISVVLSFGIWGVLTWLWFWAAGYWVLWRNYRFGDPAIPQLNRYLFVAYVLGCIGFLFIFGDIVNSVSAFTGIIGMSLALNHGVSRPRPQPKASPVATSPRLPIPARPAFQR
jgi:hypothetical protein